MSGGARWACGRSTAVKSARPGAAPTGTVPVLELRDVTLAYQKQPVLRDVSLQAAPGDVIAVVGHNGAGKTTFSLAICGLHKETSGSYLWNGKTQKPKERMKRAYMVMQDVNYQLFAESVEAECTFGIKHPDTELAEKTLTELGLAPFRERHPNTHLRRAEAAPRGSGLDGLRQGTAGIRRADERA